MTGARRRRTFAALPPGIVRVCLTGQSAEGLAGRLAAMPGVSVVTGPDAYPGDRLYLTVKVIATSGMSFVEAVLAGKAELADVDDWVDAWHEDKTRPRALSGHLGLTAGEYTRWVMNPGTLAAIIDERRLARQEVPRA